MKKRLFLLFLISSILLPNPNGRCEDSDSVTQFFSGLAAFLLEPRLASLLSEPMVVGDLPSSTQFELRNQEIHLRAVLAALKSIPPPAEQFKGDSEMISLYAGKRQAELAIINCVLIINKINQVNNVAPSDGQVENDTADGLKALFSDSDKQTTAQNIMDGLKIAKAVDSIASAIDANSKLTKLQEAYRDALGNLRETVREFSSRFKKPIKTPISMLAGIGTLLDKSDGNCVINEVVKNTGAERAGLEVGDIIVKIGGVSIVGLELPKITNMLCGEPGSKVALDIQRGAQQKSVLVERQAKLQAIGYITSWDGVFNADAFSLKNLTGLTLKDCCIAVEVHYINDNGEDDYVPHLHFLQSWEPGATALATYPIKSNYNIGASPHLPTTIKVWVHSSTGDFDQELDFAGAYRDSIIRDHCNNIRFTATYNPPSVGLLTNSNGQIVLGFSGVQFLRPSRITLTAYGDPLLEEAPHSVYKEFAPGDTWTGPATIEHPVFDVKPSRIRVTIEFPDTSYKHEIEIKIP